MAEAELLDQAQGADPEVRHLHAPLRVEQDVGRLEVAVDHPARVPMREGLQDRLRQGDHLSLRQRPLPQPLGERPAPQQLARDIGRVEVHGRALDPHDPRVVEVEQDLGLAHQAGGQLGAGDLEGDLAPGLVLGPVDRPLPPAPEDADHPVAVDERARGELARARAAGQPARDVAGAGAQRLARPGQRVGREGVEHLAAQRLALAHGCTSSSRAAIRAWARASRRDTLRRSQPIAAATSSKVRPPS